MQVDRQRIQNLAASGESLQDTRLIGTACGLRRISYVTHCCLRSTHCSHTTRPVCCLFTPSSEHVYQGIDSTFLMPTVFGVPLAFGRVEFSGMKDDQDEMPRLCQACFICSRDSIMCRVGHPGASEAWSLLISKLDWQQRGWWQPILISMAGNWQAAVRRRERVPAMQRQ